MFWFLFISIFLSRLAFFLYTCVCVRHSVVSDSLRPHGLSPTRLLCPWDSPGKNNGVGCHALLQGTFPTQGPNPGLPHRRWILYLLSTGSSTSSLQEGSPPIYGYCLNICLLAVFVTIYCLPCSKFHLLTRYYFNTWGNKSCTQK